MMRSLSAGFLLFTVLAGTAVAADVEFTEPAQPSPAVFDWTGFYVGLQAGYGMVDVEAHQSFRDFEEGDTDEATIDVGQEGVLGGAYFGFNWQMRQLVLGVEAEGNFANISGDATERDEDIEDGERELFIQRLEWEQNWSTALRARFGFLPADNVLAYASVGWSVGDFDYGDLQEAFIGEPPETGSDDELDETLNGLQVGGGLEARLLSNVGIRADVVYTRYEESEVTFTEIDEEDGEIEGEETFSVQPDMLAGRLGISIGF